MTDPRANSTRAALFDQISLLQSYGAVPGCRQQCPLFCSLAIAEGVIELTYLKA
jgi:hypothetical protein